METTICISPQILFGQSYEPNLKIWRQKVQILIWHVSSWIKHNRPLWRKNSGWCKRQSEFSGQKFYVFYLVLSLNPPFLLFNTFSVDSLTSSGCFYLCLNCCERWLIKWCSVLLFLSSVTKRRPSGLGGDAALKGVLGMLLCLHTEAIPSFVLRWNPIETCEECRELLRVIPRPQQQQQQSWHVLFGVSEEWDGLDYM